MSNYIIRRTSPHGGFVSQNGSYRSYTPMRGFACHYPSYEAAMADCCGNEVVEPATMTRSVQPLMDHRETARRIVSFALQLQRDGAALESVLNVLEVAAKHVSAGEVDRLMAELDDDEQEI